MIRTFTHQKDTVARFYNDNFPELLRYHRYLIDTDMIVLVFRKHEIATSNPMRSIFLAFEYTAEYPKATMRVDNIVQIIVSPNGSIQSKSLTDRYVQIMYNIIEHIEI